jgi:phenylacetate-coenzyme A ligase PaaK-like adenylate-forming protein
VFEPSKGKKMFETAFAQLRTAASIALGIRFSPRALERLVDAARATQQEFGTISLDSAEMLAPPTLDEETRRDLQLRRFRKQAKLALETPYYRTLFERLHLHPEHLCWEDIQNIPLTPKTDLRNDSDAFVRQAAQPYLRTTTTGTTGRITSIYFSQHEVRVMVALSALGFLTNRLLSSADLVQINTSSRAALGNLGLSGACFHIGATVFLAGIVPPQQTLALLSEEHHLPGKKPKVSAISIYPSYLGELVETGLRLGYRPSDFGLEKVFVGGEIVTAGLKERARHVFGNVAIHGDYAMTETLPFGGQLCSQGHLHFEPSLGLMEVINPETGQTAKPGEFGTIVVTPFPPYRETTILVRYNTEDLVYPLAGPMTCEKQALPATTNLLGKLRLSVRHERGWIFPRQILEALEAIEEVPLPARCGFWPTQDGVAVEVVTRADNARVRAKIERSLGDQGVPVRELYLVSDPAQLQSPYPLRCDLKESVFGNPSTLVKTNSPAIPSLADKREKE